MRPGKDEGMAHEVGRCNWDWVKKKRLRMDVNMFCGVFYYILLLPFDRKGRRYMEVDAAVELRLRKVPA